MDDNKFSIYKYPCKGKGEIIEYKVFDGIEIVFMDFNTQDAFFPDTQYRDMTEITWCLEGRVECEFPNHTISHLQSGDFGIQDSQFLPISYRFPLKIFKAATLIIDKKNFSNETIRIMKCFSIDLEKFYETLGLDRSWYVCNDNRKLTCLFHEIYEAKEIEDRKYFSIKALEILYHVQHLTKINRCKVKYYTRDQIEKVKEIKEYLLSDFDNKKNIEKYVLKYGMGITKFRTIFTQIYGDTPKVYEIKYKMAIAIKLLNNKNENITSIAVKLGYSNPSKFTATFRKFYGVLPKDYRKKC